LQYFSPLYLPRVLYRPIIVKEAIVALKATVHAQAVKSVVSPAGFVINAAAIYAKIAETVTTAGKIRVRYAEIIAINAAVPICAELVTGASIAVTTVPCNARNAVKKQ